MTIKEHIENRIVKLKEIKDTVEHCEMPDWIYADELGCVIDELKQILRFIENSKGDKE